MTAKEFEKACSRGGYCTADDAKKWASLHPKEDYSERDMIDAYRAASEWDNYENTAFGNSAKIGSTIDGGRTTAGMTRYCEDDDTDIIRLVRCKEI